MIHYSKITGEVLHHKDCTYCVYRLNIPTKEGRKNRTFELCQLHKLRCAPVNSIERYCPDYKQVGCECEACS